MAQGDYLVINGTDLVVEIKNAGGTVITPPTSTTGPEGPVGPQGPIGLAGPTGDKGLTGDKGPTGSAGPLGAAGPIGQAGPQGAAGLAGPMGPMGPAGTGTSTSSIGIRTVNVRDFGAKGDYNKPQANAIGTGTDDSAAFKAAIQFIINNTKRVSQWNDRAPNYVLYVPGGSYYITQSDALLPGSYTTPAIGGLRIYGDGREITEIVYNPPAGAGPLMNNNNGFNFITVEDIGFTSVGDLPGYTLDNTFFKSQSNNQAQNFIFNRCQFGGGWKHIWHLVGVNTNSECSFFHCGIGGGVKSAFFIPPDTGGNANASNKGSDQMVNYNFYSCQFEVSRGNYMRLDAGGNVNIWGGSIINTSGLGSGDGSTDNTFFKLGLAKATVNNGTYRFHCEGIRFERRGAVVNKIMECDWDFGTVEFNSCDMAVHSWVPGEGQVVAEVYNFKSNGGPIVNHTNCMIEGKHQYKYSGNNWTRSSKVLYKGCEIYNYSNVEDFIIMTNNEGINNGGAPVIDFEQCRGAGGSKYINDQSMNWHTNSMGQTIDRTLNVSDPNGNMPRNPTDFYLPLNSFITSILVFVPPGATAVTGAGWNYYVKDGNGTTLATIKPIGDNPSNGFNTNIALAYFADTDAKRHLTVTSSGVTAEVNGLLLIKYNA